MFMLKWSFFFEWDIGTIIVGKICRYVQLYFTLVGTCFSCNVNMSLPAVLSGISSHLSGRDNILRDIQFQ